MLSFTFGNVNTTMQLLTSAFCAICWSNDCLRRKIILSWKLRFAKEIISVLQRMRVTYDSVYSDSSAAGICLEKIGNCRKKILRQKVEKRSGVEKVSEVALSGTY